MTNYVHGQLSYQDYLKANEPLRVEINGQTRSLIASNDELKDVFVSIDGTLSAGFEQLSYDLREVAEKIGELTSVFQWGFSELIAGIGNMNDSLERLIQIAKTPAQTWAYEQYEIARDAFSRGLYEESLEYLYRAIDGHGDHTGYKLEHRFHFMLGTIRIGSFKNTSAEIINLAEAEQAFLAAAKYAGQDNAQEAGRALLAAGWAAYCTGEMKNAQECTRRAIQTYHALPEAHFQLAKIRMHCNSPDEALPSLRTAIELDRGYAIKAYSDDDIKTYEPNVVALINELRERYGATAKTTVEGLRKQVTELENVMDSPLGGLQADLNEIKGLMQEAERSLSNQTYFGNLDAIIVCKKAQNPVSVFLEKAGNILDQKVSAATEKIKRTEEEGGHSGWLAAAVALMIIVMVIVTAFSAAKQEYERAGVINAFFELMGYLVGYGILGLLVGSVLYFILRIMRKHKMVSAIEEEKRGLADRGGTITGTKTVVREEGERIRQAISKTSNSV